MCQVTTKSSHGTRIWLMQLTSRRLTSCLLRFVFFTFVNMKSVNSTEQKSDYHHITDLQDFVGFMLQFTVQNSQNSKF